ncbi:hypothetical protein KRR23_27195 [Pseudomonas sp. CVAP|uniref:hypothetical protein n=1 Tax=Pseudomonas sp. CVAP\|nr:hypothetical protein [Pseudomonas sp. CVAP\
MKKITLKPLSLTATDPLDTQNPTQRPNPIFTVTPNIDTETLRKRSINPTFKVTI